MIEPIQGLPDGVTGLRAIGEVTREDYEQVVRPLFDAKRDAGERVRFLFHFAPGFERFTVGAAWEDFKVGMRHMRLLERCAVVSDKAWIRGSSQAVGAVLPGTVRSFPEEELAAAVAWLDRKGAGSKLGHRALVDRGVLVLEPHGKLHAEDIDRVTALVDEWIESAGCLPGLVIHTPKFPGWEDFGTFVDHLRFVRGHHEKIERVALSANGKVGEVLPSLAKHFVKAEVRQFDYEDVEHAITWAAGEDGN